MRKNMVCQRVFVIFNMLLLLVCLLFPANLVSAAEVKWPDFERIDGNIEGFPLQLMEGPNINGGDSEPYMHLYFRYAAGDTDEEWREIKLTTSYFPDPSLLYGGSLTSFMNSSKAYGGSEPRADGGADWRDEHLAMDDYHEIEWVNTDEWYSVLFQMRSDGYRIPWNGIRLSTYHENYLIKIEGRGRGWQSDAEFMAAFDMAEQYAKDSIDGLEGGLTLKHYAPLTYLTAGGGYDHRPAGDLIAILTGKDGKPVKNETVVFYVEPGSTLEKVLKNGIGANWLKADILGAGANPVVLGDAVTDKNGEAYLNYLWPNLIDAEAFTSVMKEQRYLNDDEGKISGKIYAVTIDRDDMKVVHKTSVDVEFTALAKIVRITGEGRTDEFKDAYIKQYPDSPAWGTGKVRVKRSIIFPNFDYTPVEEGFLLMPGDIIDIDGGVEAEIVWLTGDRAIAKVPDKITYGDTEVRPSHSRLILSTSSYDSGFYNTLDKIQGGIFGFSIGQGLEVLSGIHPVATGVKKGGEFVVSVYDAIKEANFTDRNLMVKIRLRSIVSIDTTGEETVIQTFEGTPDVLTAGGETTLGIQEMVKVAVDGTLGETIKFNVKEEAGEWSATIAEWETAAETLLEGSASDSSDSGDSGGPVGTIIGIIIAAVVVAGGIFVLRKRKS
ncbi:hypothetical protein ACFLXY_07325 [Chloroflexota bacterium]